MASEMDTINSIKRRKTDGSVATSLSDLPIGILEHAASFLAAPSRALFAVALFNNENNNPPNENYSSIAGSNWDTLDFGEIEKDLAARLSDDDISGVLQVIDAVNTVKRLRLTNCINITGEGLEPLRGSTIIEQIDLSLVGDGEDPRFDPEPPISCELVTPILDSIIEREGCSIKHLQFPYKWRRPRNRSTDSVFHAFIERYNEMRENRDTVTCLHCKLDLPNNENDWIATNARVNGEYYGTHAHSCYQCFKHYCYDCHNGDDKIFGYCNQCQRDYCKDCVKVDHTCHFCSDFICEYCSKKIECKHCDASICSGCIEIKEGFTCFYCDLVCCKHCNSNESTDTIRYCEQCSKSCCNSCRLRKYHEGGIKCIECIKSLPNEVLQVLLEQSSTLKQEVEELKIEVKKLKDVNKELQDEVKELKDDKQDN